MLSFGQQRLWRTKQAVWLQCGLTEQHSWPAPLALLPRESAPSPRKVAFPCIIHRHRTPPAVLYRAQSHGSERLWWTGNTAVLFGVVGCPFQPPMPPVASGCGKPEKSRKDATDLTPITGTNKTDGA